MRSIALQQIKRSLIVSCQAPVGSPLDSPYIIAAMAQASERGGAAGLRIAGMGNIRRVRRVTSLPVIGIEKLRSESSPVYITPTLQSIRRVHRAGAHIIALDCTGRKRPGSHSLEQAMREAKHEIGATVMADIATLDEGIQAVELGADLVGTTLNGYTEASRTESQGPAFRLLRELVRRVDVPVLLEGRVRTPDDVRRAFDLGAYAVVVGTAVTGIEFLTREFALAADGKNLDGLRSRSRQR